MSHLRLIIFCLSIYFSATLLAQETNFNNMNPEQAEELQKQLQDYQKEQQEQFKQFQEQQKSGGGAPIQAPAGSPSGKANHVEPAKAGQFTQNPVTVYNSKDLEKKVASRLKDPFMLPNHLFFKIKKKLGDVQGEGYVDESVSPQQRWALKYYRLVAIIWNVKKPKAMVTDRKGDIHMFYVGDRIANNEGVITAIHSGEVVILEKGTETKLKMM